MNTTLTAVQDHHAAAGVASTALLIGPMVGFPTLPLLLGAMSLASDCNSVFGETAMAGVRAIAPASIGGNGNITSMLLVANGSSSFSASPAATSAAPPSLALTAAMRSHYANFNGALAFDSLALVVAPFLFHVMFMIIWTLVTSCMKSASAKRAHPYQRKGSVFERHGVVAAVSKQQQQQQRQPTNTATGSSSSSSCAVVTVESKAVIELPFHHAPSGVGASSKSSTGGENHQLQQQQHQSSSPTTTSSSLACISKLPWISAFTRLLFPELSVSLIFACTPLLLFLSIRVISNDDGDSNVAGGVAALIFALVLFGMQFYAAWTCAQHTSYFYTDVRGIESHPSTEWNTTACPAVLWLHYDPDKYKGVPCVGGSLSVMTPAGSWLADDECIRHVCQMPDPAHEPSVAQQHQQHHLRTSASSSSTTTTAAAPGSSSSTFCSGAILSRLSLARAFRCAVRPFKLKYSFVGPVATSIISLLGSILLALPSSRVACTGIYVVIIIISVLFGIVSILLRPFRNPQDNAILVANSLLATLIARTGLNGAALDASLSLFVACAGLTLFGILLSIVSAILEEVVWEPKLIEEHMKNLNKLHNSVTTGSSSVMMSGGNGAGTGGTMRPVGSARTAVFDSVVFGHQGMSDEGWGDGAEDNTNHNSNSNTTTASRRGGSNSNSSSSNRGGSNNSGCGNGGDDDDDDGSGGFSAIPMQQVSPRQEGEFGLDEEEDYYYYSSHNNNNNNNNNDDQHRSGGDGRYRGADDGEAAAAGRVGTSSSSSSNACFKDGLTAASAGNVSYYRRQVYSLPPSAPAAAAAPVQHQQQQQQEQHHHDADDVAVKSAPTSEGEASSSSQHDVISCRE